MTINLVSLSNDMWRPTWSSVETAGVEELQRKMDVDVAKKH